MYSKSSEVERSEAQSIECRRKARTEDATRIQTAVGVTRVFGVGAGVRTAKRVDVALIARFKPPGSKQKSCLQQ
jgi:hypothetical protein